MPLQLTPFDPYAPRSAAPPAPAPEPAAAVPAAKAAPPGADPGGGAAGRRPPEPLASAIRGERTAGAGRGPDAGGAADAGPALPTVSLGQASPGRDGAAPPAEPAAGRMAAPTQPPMSEQMLDFLRSMWSAGAQAITLPKDGDPGSLPGTGVDAVAGVGGTNPAPSAPRPAAAGDAGDAGTGQDAGRSSGARSAAAPARAGDAPILGNALADGPSVAAPAAAPLVYADPSLRRPSGR